MLENLEPFLWTFLIILTVALIFGLIAIIYFVRRKKLLIPKILLIILTTLELPLKRLSLFFSLDPEVVDIMITTIRNKRNLEKFAKIPPKYRAIFMPQCLRNPRCPARTSEDGIQCISCNQCGLGKIKDVALNRLGYGWFFIAPGGSLVGRMVKKYRPRAVLGIGCAMEIKEGTGLIESVGLPVQAVRLTRSGCVNTRVDVKKLFKAMALGIKMSEKEEKEYYELADEISKLWKDDVKSE